MWLRILDFMGLTNLTDIEVCEYYERARKLGSRSTDEEEKERFGRLLKRYLCLEERVLDNWKISALLITIPVAIIMILSVGLQITSLSSLHSDRGDRVTFFLCDENGAPQGNFIIEGLEGRLVITNEKGIAYLDSRWVDQSVIIRDANDLNVAILKVIPTNAQNVIKIVIPSSGSGGQEDIDQIKDMLYRPSMKKNEKIDANEPNSGDNNE